MMPRMSVVGVVVLALIAFASAKDETNKASLPAGSKLDLHARLAAARSRSKRSLRNFGDMIACGVPQATGLFSAARRYNGYGCWCGSGGMGMPVDAIDRCCQVHDACYDAIPNCRPKWNEYNWQCNNGRPTCGGGSWWGKTIVTFQPFLFKHQ